MTPDFREALVPESLNAMEPRDAFRLLLDRAVTLNASDLFLLSDEDSLNVSCRRLGALEPITRLSREQGRLLLNYIKAEAGMDLGERRRPQEGRWLRLAGGREVDLRINFIPTLYGEDLTARLLDRKFGLKKLDEIGLLRSEYNKLTAVLNSPSGLVLVTGPTGTGKTTTLYAGLQFLYDGSRKINTLEDPVEYTVPGVRQSQVNSKLGIDFPELLRNILRQASDVIMVGEIRDEETATTAVRAANSGTIVLATLHAPVAAAAVQSMVALGANRFFLSSCLLAVLAQRLVRTLCPQCRVAYDISEAPETFADVQPLLEPGLGSFIYGPGGCEACLNQGYAGRTGIFEMMAFNRALRQAIVLGAPTEEIQQLAITNGMLEFRRAAMLKVAQGVTSAEEVLRELPAEYLGLEL
jgi:type II secretory ATPase GspE/PulE/Tfp pilus assembly ATPase PilB-like protein